MKNGSTTAVYSAIIGNSVVMVAKFIAFFFSGSSAMLSEGIHSFADVSNQCLIAFGINRSKKHPDKKHPYGYMRERYIWSLISAVGIFFLGCGVTVYHGISTLINPGTVDDFKLAFYILAFAFIVEGATLLVAIKAVKKDARDTKVTFFKYITEGTDPTGVAVILEDSVAVLGVLIAAAGLFLTYLTGDTQWDSYATIVIGLSLGFVAFFIAYRSKGLLVGESMPLTSRKKILKILNEDPVVKHVYDIKTAVMGAQDLRFMAEIEFNGDVIAERYLTSIDVEKIYEGLNTGEKRKEFLVHYGGHLIEAIGDEVDRIEADLKKQVPDLKYIDLEVN